MDLTFGQDARLRALRLAQDPDDTPEDVVARAKVYFDFLNGAESTPPTDD